MLSVRYFLLGLSCVSFLDSIAQVKDSLPIITKNVFTLINLTDDDLNDDNSEVANIAGIFSASDDIYLNTVGFEYQGVFYSARGLGSDQVTFLLNGVNQNRLYDDRPAWNNWGGVDGIYRNQNLSEPLGLSDKTIGRALGVNGLSTRASMFRQGTRMSYARSDRSYQNKISISHAQAYKSWHFVFTASRRWGNQGFREGTFYEANSVLLSVENHLNKKHSINASFLYTPNRRGLASTLTEEVIALKEPYYNSNWGYQNGNKRSARVREIKEPLFLLTHHYKNGDNTRLQSSVLYQTGFIGFSRIDYNLGYNPAPDYYQNLPSYWLSRDDYQNAFEYQETFINNGQLDWEALYEANAESNAAGNHDAFVLYSDKREETRLQFNSNFTHKINNNWQFNASVDFRQTTSKNFAEVLDVLGGTGYLDVASFTLVQSDLNNPDRVVNVGDKFKYHYNIKSQQIAVFSQGIYKGKNIEFGAALGSSYAHHQREGFYNYENYADAEGKSKKIDLLAFQAKINFLYKISGRHLFDLKSAYIQKSPSVKLVFPNARVSNRSLGNLDTENLLSNSFSYINRGLNHSVKLTGYYNLQNNVTETGFYFAEGFGTDADDGTEGTDLLSENSLFVQEVLNNAKKKYYGLEFSAAYNMSSSTKIKGVVGLGNYTYANHPNLILFTEDDEDAQNLGFVNGEKNLGTASIKNLKLSVGPQQAFSLILEYNDPNYWRIKVSLNHFRNNYIDTAPILYTNNFLTEINGQTIANIDDDLVTKFRAQEQLNNFTLVNMSGGKSWKLKKHYLSVFWTVQNVLGVDYRTGGFTSSRPANYSEQLREYNREKPLFGTRYFVGNGRTFFTGLYYSF